MKDFKLFIVFVLLEMLIISSCSISEQGNEVMTDEVWLEELRERDTALGELMQTISLVESSLEQIKIREGLLQIPDENEFPLSKREKILNDISIINVLLQDNRKKLTELQMRILDSGITSDALKHQISQLSHSIVTRERSVDSLWNLLRSRDSEIAKMNRDLDSLGARLTASETTIAMQEMTINEAFYTLGTKKELKQNGVLDNGLALPGVTPRMNENLNENYFTKIDIRKVKSIPVNSKRAKLVSYHSDGSFEWIKEDNKVTALEIKDPEQFWKTSKFLVIELN